MRTHWIGLGLLLTATFALGEPPAAMKLVVHEWGTFTNFAGADGVYVDFRPLTSSDLPGFVFDRERQTALTRWILKASMFDKGRIVTRSRMETPVTYFYTDEPMSVRVRVDFPQGLLTEFYPPAQLMAPLVTPGERDRPAPIGKSYLDWGAVGLFPPKDLEAGRRNIPRITDGNPYAAARETDSDIVWATNLTGNYQEKFLFYRGVGNFEMPVQMRSLGRDRFAITNGGRDPIRSAFLVDIRDGRARFSRLTDIAAAGATAALSNESNSVEALGDAMAADLVKAGLYEKEARAMVNTWRASWFGEDGTRLLYLVPQSLTDATLPLEVEPKPSATVRVMVGRLEALTPETEKRIGELTEQLGAADCGAREEAARQIRLMGRFAEPALLHVSDTIHDPEVLSRTEALLSELQGS